MNEKSVFGSIKSFFERIGKRNLVIAGAVTLVIAAVAVNWIVFSGDDEQDGFDYNASAGMNTGYGTNAGVENDQASDSVKAEALAEIQTIAKEMSQESNIESILMGKGFTQCLAVINGDAANIVVRTEGQLNPSQLAQINAVVYEQAGIEPINITIVAKN